jgi:hypothetical protein
MESGLGNSYFPVFRGGVHMDKWTPAGVQLDSRWILDKELAGLTPIKKRSKVHLDSRNPPGVHLESTWNLWLKVKSSVLRPGHCLKCLDNMLNIECFTIENILGINV